MLNVMYTSLLEFRLYYLHMHHSQTFESDRLTNINALSVLVILEV